MRKNPKKRKKVKYRKLTLKFSSRQMQSLENYCKARKTTPNKLIKKSIKFYLNNFDNDIPDKYLVTENQLDLFEIAEKSAKFGEKK